MSDTKLKQKITIKTFTAEDVVKAGNPDIVRLYDEHILYNNGLQAELFLRNPIFQDAVQDFWLHLAAQEDALPVTATLEEINEFRIQRRLLLQLIGNLDNRVANSKQMDAAHKEQQAARKEEALNSETLQPE
ncbi:MAG: hypothetical protein ORN54_10215 [Cyclobacteriaceae bacterium]|nr:hypothetical protein [Cyclobacteriaceae bacterium]